MIEKIQLLRNIGPFDSVAGTCQPRFARLTLIYAENGRGKTTLSAIFRSLGSGDPILLRERKRLGSQNAPHVIIECDGTTRSATFQNNAWTRSYPNIRIFDDSFVAQNVYSGLEVMPGHRQNLHQLIIGQQGVQLANQVEHFAAEISRLQTELRERGNIIPQSSRGILSVDDFCALTPIENIDAIIEDAQRRVLALRQAEVVRTTAIFEPFEPPTPPIEELRAVLERGLPNLDSRAVVAVQAHFRHLGERAETWVSEGMGFVGNLSSQPNPSCPFCNQTLSGLALVDNYRAYFSDAYEQHKRSIGMQIQNVERILGTGAFIQFQSLVNGIMEKHRFWAQFLSIRPFNIDLRQLSGMWQVLRQDLLRLLLQKQIAPLEEVFLDDQAVIQIQEYTAAADEYRTLSQELIQANEGIIGLKSAAATGNLAAAISDITRLGSVKARFSDEIRPLCEAYLATMNLKEEAEQRKVEAREALDRHRGVVFPRYQTAINEYLRKFSTGFRIAEVAPVDPRGTPSSTYQIEINSCLVPLNHANTGEPTPTFKSTLSAGDRNALALAFFFSSLDQEPDLSSVVVVIDDPVSSLDDGRTLTTAQEIRTLSQRAQQVILLSHSKPVLCMVWQHADQSNCSAISVMRGLNGSNIDAWNVNVEAITEYDRQHELLRCYSLGSERDFRKVAQSLRPVLEGFLRVVCSEHFQPGAQLGQFIARARTCGIAGQPIMSDTAVNELDALREYANRFHHETNQAWHTQMNNINETELNGFVRRVLDFTTFRPT